MTISRAEGLEIFSSTNSASQASSSCGRRRRGWPWRSRHFTVLPHSRGKRSSTKAQTSTILNITSTQQRPKVSWCLRDELISNSKLNKPTWTARKSTSSFNQRTPRAWSSYRKQGPSCSKGSKSINLTSFIRLWTTEVAQEMSSCWKHRPPPWWRVRNGWPSRMKWVFVILWNNESISWWTRSASRWWRRRRWRERPMKDSKSIG